MVPFIIGIAAGASVVVAIQNREKIKKGVTSSVKTAKGLAQEGYEKGKEGVKTIKANVSEKIDCLTSDKSDQKTEKSQEETLIKEEA